MADKEENDNKDPSMEDIDEAIHETYSDLMDVNHRIIMRSRRQAAKIEQLLELYAEQIQRLNDLRDLHIEGARALSETIGEILATEWDLSDEDTDEEDDGNDEEDDN